jgi:hypothetical protein
MSELAVVEKPKGSTPLAAAVAEMDLTATAEDMILVLGRVQEAQRELKLMREHVEARLVEKLRTLPGRAVQFGTVKYYVGAEKKVKCRDVRLAILALMDAAGGDFAAFSDTLSANAIKQGAAKKVLGPAFDQHFETTTEEVLEEGKAKPAETLHVFDERFRK